MAKDSELVPAQQQQVSADSYAIMEALIASVPQAGEDAVDSIVRTLAEVGSVDDLDKPWRTEGMRELNGVAMDVLAIRQAPSDYETGWNFFLLVDAFRHDTGEKIVTTTGSVSIVAQLLKAHALGAFPLRCVPRVADRPSRSGFYPMHLEILRTRSK